MTDEIPFKLGQLYEFYGVDNQMFKIDSDVIEVIEDPDDGYRSYLGSVAIVNPEALSTALFFPNPIDTITIRERKGHDSDGYQIVGSDGHVWLEFGTDDYSDYYPYFVFTYTPMRIRALK